MITHSAMVDFVTQVGSGWEDESAGYSAAFGGLCDIFKGTAAVIGQRRMSQRKARG